MKLLDAMKSLVFKPCEPCHEVPIELCDWTEDEDHLPEDLSPFRIDERNIVPPAFNMFPDDPSQSLELIDDQIAESDQERTDGIF